MSSTIAYRKRSLKKQYDLTIRRSLVIFDGKCLGNDKGTKIQGIKYSFFCKKDRRDFREKREDK